MTGVQTCALPISFALRRRDELREQWRSHRAAILTVGLLSPAAYALVLYALQLAWIDYQLKNKKLAFNQEMPPLMSIERKMFHITQIGVVLLTLTLCTGLFYMHNLFSMENIDKAVLSIVAWFVYIVLLWGHYHEGWRGRRVVWFNVAGAVILTLAYFGSRIVQQLIS